MKLKPLCRLMLMCWAIPVHANPVSPQVVHGTAGFATNGNTLTVTNSANAIINWQSFSIGANETTRFIQPSASSAVLNRVLGSDPSQILGQLQSNGRVFLINPAGILVGAGARIDVAGLVVSTLNLSNEDFLAGRMNFAANPLAGRVVNQGAITTGMGGTVVLVGAQVSNEGIITTLQGQTVLAAGETVQLQELGAPGLTVEITGTANTAINLGRIVADAGQIGIVGVLVKNTGLVSASRVEHEGGRIFLRATEELKLSASGDIAARGGGFVDTSAPKVKIEEGVRIDTEGGEWLIDPVDFTIAASGGDMTGATLSANLGSGSVTIQSTSGGAGTSGNVNVNDTVSWSSNKLTLNAQNNININSPMNGSGTASLALEYGQGAVTSGNASDYYVNAPVNLPAGMNFSTKRGSDGALQSFSGLLTWDGGASTLNWWDANNWSTNQVPTATDAVYLDIAGTNAVHYIGATESKLAGALICNENFTLDAGVLTIDGAAKWAETLDISSNALILNGTTEVATLAMTSGSIGGTGNLTVTQGYSQSAAGYINMWGSNSQIAITQATGNLNIYGALSTTGSLALRTSEATGDILVQSAVRSGNMTVSARNITLNADQNSSGDNRLVELSATGAQTITATGELMLKAGTTGQAKDAQIISLGAQNISANKITLTGGGTGSGDTNNSARITHEYCRWSGSTCASGGSGNQTITLTGSNATLNLTGGAGSGAGLYYNNDCTTALGSSTACYASDNRATIQNYLGDQTITFDSTGGAITLQGGRNGGSNSADIRNAQWKNYNYSAGDSGPQPGTQTIGGTSGNTATNPNITLTSGVSGGWSVYYTKNGKDVIENFENEAGIGTDGASQIIRAKDVLLDGNATATATTIGGAYMGGDPLTGNFTQTIDVTGNLTLRGGNSGGVGALNDATKKDLSGAAGLYAEARESGKTATSTITVVGDVAFTGGGSAYSPAFMATQSGSMMTLTATGTVSLDAGSSNSFVLFGRFGELADNIPNWSLWAGKVKFANVGGATSVRLNANASGTALKIIGNLDNDIDAAILATPNGRWLVYAASSASVTKGGLTSNFRHYGVTNAYSPAITETGNGFLYASSAGNLSVTTTLTGGTASHEYGQTPTATFGYTLSGTFADAEDTAANIGVTDGIYSFTPTSTSAVGSYTRKYSSGMTSRAGYGFILATTDSGVAYTVNEAPVTTAPAAATTASNDVTTSTIAATTTVTASETTTVATAAVSTATTESTATTTTETTTTETTTAQSAVATTTVVISTTPATSNLPSVTLVGGTTGGGTNEFGGSTTTPATTVTTTTTVTTVAEPTQSEAPKAQESKPADKPKENKPKEDKPKEDKPQDKPQDKPKDDKPKAKPKQCA